MRDISLCNVAVVGGAGFLGSHLVNHLIDDRTCKVLVVDNLVSGRREFVHREASFEHHDITGSEGYLLDMFKQYEIEYVFNYAAFPYIPVSFERPLHVFNVNAFGALKVINAAEEAGCKGILQVSSAEIYGGPPKGSHDVKGKIDERYPITPHSSYGASKAAIDAMVQVRWRENKTPVIALRQFNCVGERETHPYVIPEIISQVYINMHDKTGMITSNAVQVKLGNNSNRDFQYAGDAVRMATELLEKGEFGDVYNMGSEDYIGIYSLAELIGTLMKVQVEVVEDPVRKRPWEIWHLQSDNSKLYSVIDARPEVPLKQALKQTINDFYLEGKRWCWQ
jgi:nucleoside-diphosphate-sugar epimerase